MEGYEPYQYALSHEITQGALADPGRAHPAPHLTAADL